jgi:hypothetical protein
MLEWVNSRLSATVIACDIFRVQRRNDGRTKGLLQEKRMVFGSKFLRKQRVGCSAMTCVEVARSVKADESMYKLGDIHRLHRGLAPRADGR